MSDMTCAEFQAFMARALARFGADWRASRAADGETFPERLELEDWWRDFAAVTECDVIERDGRERTRRRPAAASPLAADARAH